MKRYLIALVALMVMMFAGNAMAFTPPPPPPSGWYVVDQANVLTPGQVDEINHRILAVSKVTKNEFGVLILQSMDGANIDDVANATYRAWGVGKRGLDNGILLAISVGDRKWRIEVGKGVEGDVTDLQAADVGRNHLVPHLKQRPMDWYGGILETVNTLDSLMESRINARVPVAAGVPRPLQYANTAPLEKPSYKDYNKVNPPPSYVDPPLPNPVVITPPVVVPSPVVSAPNAVTESSPDGIGVFLFVGLVVLLVVGGIFLYSSYRSSKEEEERQRELAILEAQNRRARAAQEAADRVAREQEATRLRNQEALNRQATATVVPTPTRHTVHHVDNSWSESYVPKPSRPLDVPVRPRPVVVQAPPPRDTSAEDAIAAAALAAAAAAASREEERRERDRQERAERQARAREEEEREARRRERDEEDERQRRRDQEEADDRRRRDEESSRRSNDWSSPSSSNDSGSWGGGDSGGGGFGGGDSGGGGASGDF